MRGLVLVLSLAVLGFVFAGERDVRPVMAKYCFACHGGGESEGGLRLDGALDAETWAAVAARVAAGEMPPEGERRPSGAEAARLLEFARATAAAARPGRVTLRRLNRFEYANTIRDLLGVEVTAAADLPLDDTGYGFDNVGDVLSLSPLHLEKYLAAAEAALAAALVLAPPVARTTTALAGAELDATTGGTASGDGRWLWSNGEAYGEVSVPVEGEYLVRVEAAAAQAGPEPARMAILADRREVQRFDVREEPGRPGTFEARTRLGAGRHRIGAAFLNDHYRPDAPDPRARDRNLLVVRIEVDGPLDYLPAPPPETHRRVFFVTPGDDLEEVEAARMVLTRFASRAWRRPATTDEIGRLVALFRDVRPEEATFAAAVAVPLAAVLVSPHFLFLVEGDAADGPRPLTGIEVATRLSYFLWSGPPDEELLALAGRGALADPAVIAAQADRMLADPKADRFVTSFAGQWLGLRALDAVTPDPARFPEFDDALRDDMRRETELFFASIVREDRSLLHLILANDTFLNERLARHYGIPGITGPEFRRVRLTDPARGGVLTQASVLTLTSNPTRTSPVKRGKWVLEQILAAAPPPPPADVPDLPDSEAEAARASLRDRMRRHREDPACAVCHREMDPIGFAFENYDAVGRWRDRDGPHAIDATGVLPDGSTFAGAAGLKRVLLLRKDRFVRAFARALSTYALGRGLGPGDEPFLGEVAAAVERDGYRFRAVVRAIVTSELFRTRRPEGGGE